MPIAIYAGEGALPVPFAGRRLTAQEIQEIPWHSSCSLFIMPGGRDLPYHLALKGLGNNQIRRFVENGGTYFGICAGAYYGAERVEFDPGFPLEVCGKRELAFFKGKAVGPAFGFGTFDYASNKGARAAKLITGNETFYAYYNGGCTFEGDFSNCKILASYAALPGCPPAIIECQVGQGKAILSGVHLETSWNDLDPNDLFLKPLIPLLKSSEPKKNRFLGNLPTPSFQEAFHQ